MSFAYWPVVALVAFLARGTGGQLSFHNDPSQNSFSIKLPAFQQTFTRYFGNQPQGALLQQPQPLQQYQQQQQQQQQQRQQIPNPLAHQSLIGAQAQAYQQQQQPVYYQQPAQQPAQPPQDGLNRYVAQFPDQPHYTVQENYINPNIRMRLQQQRLLQQQQQQQQQQYNAPYNTYQGYVGASPQQAPTAQDAGVYSAGAQDPQYEYVQQQAQDGPEPAPVQYQPTNGPRGAQQPAGSDGEPGKLIGVAFSPSNEVSQVKFSSGGLKYNF